MRRRTFLKTLPLPLLGAPAGSAAIRVDSDGCITVDEKREFILGSYHLPRAADPWQELREAGFNLVHVPPTRENLAKAGEHKLYTWIRLGHISPQTRSESQEKIRRTVTQCKAPPHCCSGRPRTSQRSFGRNRKCAFRRRTSLLRIVSSSPLIPSTRFI